MIEALPYIGIFIAIITFGVVIYSIGYVQGADDVAEGRVKLAVERWEAFNKCRAELGL